MTETTHQASILIVDDDEASLNLLRIGLRARGFANLSVAASGQEALEQIAVELPDIVLLDVMMPHMDGFEVVRRIRQVYPDEFVPIILISALQRAQDRVTGIEAGANDFISKPYDVGEVVARINGLLALKQARDELNAERARFEALFNQTGNPVIVADGEGRITYFNPAAGRQIPLAQETLGAPLAQALHPALDDLLLQAHERQSAVSGEIMLYDDAPGEECTFNVSFSPVENVGFMLVLHDITAIKEGERRRLQSERAQTQRVLDALSRYMSPALVERVLGDPDILTRRERREALVLFADLRGFTRLTVERPPDDVIALLNDFFTEMLEIVYAHEGVIFDITGDELLAAFNVPYSQPDAHERALATAVAMQRRFAELRARWAGMGMPVGLGVGISAGPVVLGHVGGRSRMNYAMVGEAVTIAHRLVEIAEDGQIAVSPEVLVGGLADTGGLRVRELPPQAIEGVDRLQRVTMIELAG